MTDTVIVPVEALMRLKGCGWPDDLGANIDAMLAAAPKAGPVSDPQELRDLPWRALQKYQLTNMSFKDDASVGFPLIDLVSNDGTTIATGREELRHLADHLAKALSDQPLSNPQELAQIVVGYRNMDSSGDKGAAIKHLCDLLEASTRHAAPVADKLAVAVKALEPFKRHYDLNDCAEQHGSDCIEVPVHDLLNACAALAQIKGGEA